MIKKFITVLAAMIITTVQTSPAYATISSNVNVNVETSAESIRDARQDLREAKKDVRQERKDLRSTLSNLGENIRERFGSGPGILRDFFKRGRAAIGSGVVTLKNGTTLSIQKDSTTYTVLTDGKTQFRRRFWGKSSIDEISVNDTVNVIGKWTDTTHTTIQASLVRDVSIQKRFGVFFGQVLSVNANGWVMSTIGGNRPNQTVNVSTATKFTNLVGSIILQADIAVGHRVRVKGLWDNVTNMITDVREVKDFTIHPSESEGTPSPTASATATPTPSATPSPTATATPTPTAAVQVSVTITP